jgi:hypothetical protein
MARRAAVPPRTIFTKDVSKITRAPHQAREKMKIFLMAHFLRINILNTNSLRNVTIL